MIGANGGVRVEGGRQIAGRAATRQGRWLLGGLMVSLLGACSPGVPQLTAAGASATPAGAPAAVQPAPTPTVAPTATTADGPAAGAAGESLAMSVDGAAGDAVASAARPLQDCLAQARFILYQQYIGNREDYERATEDCYRRFGQHRWAPEVAGAGSNPDPAAKSSVDPDD